jgi:hypothetical protein
MADDPKVHTARALVEAQRTAWVAGHGHCRVFPPATESETREKAARLYPLPKRRVPREVTLLSTGASYRIRDGQAEYRYTGENTWYPDGYGNRKRVGELMLLGHYADVEALAGLLARPYEEVDG